jgi:hypothetical protein
MNALRMLAALFFATVAIAAPTPDLPVASASSAPGSGDVAADSYGAGGFVGWKQ